MYQKIPRPICFSAALLVLCFSCSGLSPTPTPDYKIQETAHPATQVQTAQPSASATPHSTPTTAPLALETLCMIWDDLDAEVPGIFQPNTIKDMSRFGFAELPADTVFRSIEDVTDGYIPGTVPAVLLSCDLEAYEDSSLAEHAIKLTTLMDFMAGAEYCGPHNECLALKLDSEPLPFIDIAFSSLPDEAVMLRYNRVLDKPNTSLMVQHRSLALRLNISPIVATPDKLLPPAKATELLVRLAELILERLKRYEESLIVSPKTPVLPCVLYKGKPLESCGEESGDLYYVAAAQLRLQQLGYTQVGMADGIFGENTEKAVTAYQQDNGLNVDGVIGPKTWARLFTAQP